MKNVLVSLASDSNAMRDCLIGVFEYVNSGHPLNIRLLPAPVGATRGGLTPQAVDDARAAGLAGALTGIGFETPGFRRLVESGVPLVLNNKPPRWTPPPGSAVSFVRSDDIAVGRMGARHLRAQGRFRTFAFVPCDDRNFWSILRQRGFGLELAPHGIRPQIFHRRKADLGTWLRALPKPAAVMTACDLKARDVLEACRQVRLKVPIQVAILGVDNDEIVCHSTRPTLSSVQPGNVELGRRCAAELFRLTRGHATGKCITVPPVRVVERLSTHTIPPSGYLIEAALSHMRENLGKGLSVKGIARTLHVSESLLRLRFRTVLGKSVRDTLMDMRRERVKQLLAETDKTIRQIAQLTGFSSDCRLTHFFREREGLSPTDFRTRARQ